MEMQDIIYLDCSKKYNRKWLIEKTMKTMKLKEKPSKEQLQKFLYKILQKYNINHSISIIDDQYKQLNVEVFRGSFSCCKCYSYYEALCKAILIVKVRLKYNKERIV